MRERSFPSSLIFFIRFGLFELVFLTPLVFYGWATTFSSVKQTFAQVGCLVLLCGLSFELPHRKPGLSFPDITTFFIIFFGIFLVVSSLWSASFYASFLGLGIWGTFFAVYFLTAAIVEDEKWMRLLLIAAVASGALAALYSIFQFYEVELPIWRKVTGRMRLFSTFGNPNYLAFLFYPEKMEIPLAGSGWYTLHLSSYNLYQGSLDCPFFLQHLCSGFALFLQEGIFQGKQVLNGSSFAGNFNNYPCFLNAKPS